MSLEGDFGRVKSQQPWLFFSEPGVLTDCLWKRQLMMTQRIVGDKSTGAETFPLYKLNLGLRNSLQGKCFKKKKKKFSYHTKSMVRPNILRP